MLETLLFFYTRGGPVMLPLALVGLLILTLGVYQLWYCLSYRLDSQDKESSYWVKYVNELATNVKPIKSMSMAESLEICFLKIEEELLKRVSTLRFCGQISTLMGFLGTVTGMVKTFQSVAAEGVATPSLLAGGIYEALFTTIFGLILAIIAAGFSHVISSITRSRIQNLETCVIKKLDGE